ncbi:hypothetical protein GCM10027615_49550 [Plantactinospora veratri]
MFAEVPGSGYSQSMSTPSRLYCVTKLITLFTKVVRLAALAARASKAESSPSFQPPIAIDTLTLLPCARDTSAESLLGFSTARSVPFAFGSTKA